MIRNDGWEINIQQPHIKEIFVNVCQSNDILQSMAQCAYNKRPHKIKSKRPSNAVRKLIAKCEMGGPHFFKE